MGRQARDQFKFRVIPWRGYPIIQVADSYEPKPGEEIVGLAPGEAGPASGHRDPSSARRSITRTGGRRRG